MVATKPFPGRRSTTVFLRHARTHEANRAGIVAALQVPTWRHVERAIELQGEQRVTDALAVALCLVPAHRPTWAIAPVEGGFAWACWRARPHGSTTPPDAIGTARTQIHAVRAVHEWLRSQKVRRAKRMDAVLAALVNGRSYAPDAVAPIAPDECAVHIVDGQRCAHAVIAKRGCTVWIAATCGAGIEGRTRRVSRERYESDGHCGGGFARDGSELAHAAERFAAQQDQRKAAWNSARAELLRAVKQAQPGPAHASTLRAWGAGAGSRR